MKWTYLIILISAGFIIGGCSGHIIVKKYPEYDTNGTEVKEAHGVLFRVPESWDEYFRYTTIQKADGTLSYNCNPQTHIRTVHDFPSSQLYTLGYQPREFEKHKLSVTLNANGTLASVNTESTPITLKEILESAQLASGIPGILFPAEQTTPAAEGEADGRKNSRRHLPPCTGNPQFVKRCPVKATDDECARPTQ